MALAFPRRHLLSHVPGGRVRLPARRWAGLVLATVFIGLTLAAALAPRSTFDLTLLRSVQALEIGALAFVLVAVDRLTSAAGSVAAWLALVAVLGLARWWGAATTALLMPAGGLADNVVRLLVDERARPVLGEAIRVAGADASAFPSGHAAGAVLLYGFVWALSARITHRPARRMVVTICAGVIALTAFGRVWLGAHWPTDVAGGLALGGLMLMALLTLLPRVQAYIESGRAHAFVRDARTRPWPWWSGRGPAAG
jgi:membrane-associated phospholipid phosphatase